VFRPVVTVSFVRGPALAHKRDRFAADFAANREIDLIERRDNTLSATRKPEQPCCL
jgi:hypothetical protein